jgi:rhamnogalacturonan endolyase
MVYWDADLMREIQNSGKILKWNGAGTTTLFSHSGTELIWADVIGDWREEVVTVYNNEIRIYTTTTPAADRHVALMQDPLYRNDVAVISSGYPQPPQLSYYLGTP